MKHHLAANRTPQSAARRNMFALVLGFGLTIVLAFAGVQQLIAQGPQPLPSPGSGLRSPQGGPLPTGFTYQGRLLSADTPVNGVCDIAFRLYDDPGVGNQIGGAITRTIPITGGLFTTSLDFGAGAFNGEARWLQIALSTTCPATGSFTTLSPRQALSAAPYALFSAAPWVTGSGNLSYVGGKVGIGTANPGATLQVAGSGFFGTDGGGLNPSVGAGIRIFRDGFDGVANIYAFDYGTGSPFTLTLQAPGGNVGIGTTAPADKLSVAGIVATTGGVRFGDGTLQTTAARKGQNLIVVAKSGGDFTTISAALASIVNASATNHYLVYVAPGTYTETVTMQQYVDIEGAGELTTKITSAGGPFLNTHTVLGASNAELRFLTVENTGGNQYAIAIYNGGVSQRLTHVTASAIGGTQSYGVYNSGASSPIMTNVTASAVGGTYNNGVYNSSSSPTMTNVIASASGGSDNSAVATENGSSPLAMTNVTANASGGFNSNTGIFVHNATLTMANVTVSASGGVTSTNYGVHNFELSFPTINNSTISASGGSNSYGIYSQSSSGVGTVTVNNSQVSGSTNTIYNNIHFTTRVGASQLGGGAAAANSGTLTCAGVYDENYAFFASTCP